MASSEPQLDLMLEDILDNESLTEHLDDDAGQMLLAWGIHCGEIIAASTVGLREIEREEAVYPRLQAIRRLMRYMNRRFAPATVAELADNLNAIADTNTKLLKRVVKQSSVIYGARFTAPESQQSAAFLGQWLKRGHDALPMITDVRNFIEGYLKETAVDASDTPATPRASTGISSSDTEPLMLAKTHDFLVWLVPLTAAFPPMHHQTITQRLLNAVLDFQEYLLATESRHQVQRDIARAHLDKVGLYLQLVHRLQWLAADEYAQATARLDELKDLLGRQ